MIVGNKLMAKTEDCKTIGIKKLIIEQIENI